LLISVAKKSEKCIDKSNRTMQIDRYYKKTGQYCSDAGSSHFSTQDSKGTCISIASLELILVRVNETLVIAR
jgi:hypothetical protein